MSTVAETNFVEEPRAPHAETLAASVVILLIMTVAQRVIGFGRGVLFCRWLSPEELGQWDVAFAFLNLAGPLIVLGLPGSFGRYVEYYRQRGQFRTFLWRTSLVTLIALVGGTLAIIVARDWFSRLIFGSDAQDGLVVWLTLCLAAVIVHNFLTSLFIAVRMYRVVTMLQFMQGLGFAVFSLALLAGWAGGPTSVVIGYGAATLVASLLSFGWLARLSQSEVASSGSVPQWSFWSRLVPFAVWMWVTNLISNVFDMVDRYMIIHHGQMTAEEALRQVGYYHSSRILPLLFVGVAALFASMITPHLTTDWELGRQQRVVRRLNLALKLLAGGLLVASVAVLFAAPLLFVVGFQNRFQGGLDVLPGTLTYCAWYGVFAVSQNYLWCAERAALSSLPLLVGLGVNIGLNLLWLPTYGLPGAVAATTVANLAALVLTFEFSRWHGMHVDLGTWLVSLAAGALYLGAWGGLTAIIVIALLTFTTNWIFTPDEKHELGNTLRHGHERLRAMLRRFVARPAAGDI